MHKCSYNTMPEHEDYFKARLRRQHNLYYTYLKKSVLELLIIFFCAIQRNMVHRGKEFRQALYLLRRLSHYSSTLSSSTRRE